MAQEQAENNRESKKRKQRFQDFDDLKLRNIKISSQTDREAQ